MGGEGWAAVGIFVATQIISLIVIITSLRGDAKMNAYKYTIVEAQMDDFKIEMQKLANVVTQQALDSRRMDYLEERQMTQGKRLDETEKRLNLYADSPVYQRSETPTR